MKREQVNYDWIAPIYDLLGGMLFCGRLLRSQRHFLDRIDPGSHLLIAGGGTGKILEALGTRCPFPLTVFFVEQSPAMLRQAKKRKLHPAHNVHFVAGALETTNLHPVDVIITAFFFDNFSYAFALDLFLKLDDALKPGGSWIETDFLTQAPNRFIQRAVIRSMYLFFRFAAGVKSCQLPEMSAVFREHRYILEDKALFSRGLIGTFFYRKSGVPRQDVLD